MTPGHQPVLIFYPQKADSLFNQIFIYEKQNKGVDL